MLPPLVEAQRGLDEALESGSASGPLALDHSTFSAACSFTQRMICQAPLWPWESSSDQTDTNFCHHRSLPSVGARQ